MPDGDGLDHDDADDSIASFSEACDEAVYFEERSL